MLYFVALKQELLVPFSSPIRIIRNEHYESNIVGIYPCGEGAGYAGGITSAAIDGLKVSEAIMNKFKPLEK